MARKRMISPEIWESQDFSALSDLAKIVFISLFSHADDEGRGRADPTYIKSSTFPYDEGRRVADIKSALSEIARSMSVQFYSVNGIEFYFMTSWERWQKIDKPSKSKFPPPPSVGVGGDILNSRTFDEHSTNTTRTFVEGSPPNIIENNIIKDNIKEDKVSKKVSNKKERESYDEILDGCGVTGRYKDVVIEFIRYLKTSYGIVMLNDRLEDMIVALDRKYRDDELSKRKEIRRAIVNGYKRLECEEVQ